MIDTFYGKFVNTMFKNIPHENDVDNYLNDFGLIHAATGIAGEAGEILDLTKKIVFTGKKYAREDLIREMGDLEFDIPTFSLARISRYKPKVLLSCKLYPCVTPSRLGM